MTFTKDVFSELTSFVNRNNLESGCYLPDYVIARHLEAAYFSLCDTVQDVVKWINEPPAYTDDAGDCPPLARNYAVEPIEITEELRPNPLQPYVPYDSVSEVTVEAPEDIHSWTLSGGNLAPTYGEDWESLQSSTLAHMTESEDTDTEALLGEVPTFSASPSDPYAVTVINGILSIGGKATAKQIQWGLEQLGLQEVAVKINNVDCSGSHPNGLDEE